MAVGKLLVGVELVLWYKQYKVEEEEEAVPRL